MTLADAELLLAELKDAHLQATADVNSYWLALTTDNAVLSSAKGALARMGKVLSDVLAVPGGTLTRRVLAGEKTWAQWVQLAREQREGVSYVLAQVKSSAYSWGRLWGEVFVPTAQQTTQLAKDTYEDAVDLAPFVSVAVVALVALVGLVYLGPLLRR